jgi:site-specific DNA-methyltransferase (adenine-specific)
VIDPFMGSGTTAVVARNNGRKYIGCELNPEYVALSEKRISESVVSNLKDFIEK